MSASDHHRLMDASDFPRHQDEDRLAIEVPGGRLEFLRVRDRWSHALIPTAAGDERGPAHLASIEVEPGREDPERVLSPVYQELQVLEPTGGGGGGCCVLLTGHMLKHHFSASMRISLDPASRRLVLDVDVADRCRSPIAALSATYLVGLTSGALADATQQAILWDGLEVTAQPPGRLALAEAGRHATRVQAMAAIDPSVFTHRLRYRWSWSVPSA